MTLATSQRASFFSDWSARGVSALMNAGAGPSLPPSTNRESPAISVLLAGRYLLIASLRLVGSFPYKDPLRIKNMMLFKDPDYVPVIPGLQLLGVRLARRLA